MFLHDIANKLNVKLRTIQHQINKAFENNFELKNTIIKDRQKFRKDNRSKYEIIKIKDYYKKEKTLITNKNENY